MAFEFCFNCLFSRFSVNGNVPRKGQLWVAKWMWEHVEVSCRSLPIFKAFFVFSDSAFLWGSFMSDWRSGVMWDQETRGKRREEVPSGVRCAPLASERCKLKWKWDLTLIKNFYIPTSSTFACSASSSPTENSYEASYFFLYLDFLVKRGFFLIDAD